MIVSPLSVGLVNADGKVSPDAFTQLLNDLRGAAITLWLSGTTAQRPNDPVLGQIYFDTTLGSLVVCTAVRAGVVPAVWSTIGGGGVAITKTLRTFIAAGTTNNAGTTTTGNVLDETTTRGGLITAKITNGAAAPTIAASVKIYTSGDNFATAGKLFATLTGDVVNNSVNEWAVVMTQDAMYVRVDVTGNTVQNVTCEAFMQEMTTG